MKKIAFTSLMCTLLLCNCSISDKYENGVTVTLPSQKVLNVRVLSPTIVKVAMAKNDSLLHLNSLIANDNISKNVTFDVKEQKDNIIVTTDSLIVKINAISGDISYFDTSKNLLMSEHGKTLKPCENVNAANQSRISQQFNWSDDEVIYGLGQHELSSLNMRGQTIDLLQLNTRIAVPVIVSSKGYGLYWDNYSLTRFDDSNNQGLISSEVADKIQYYFVKGAKIDSVISGLRTLTGHSPMLPRWAFGYNQSRNRYKTRQEMTDVVAKMRKLNIPMDAIIIDYYHWNKKDGFGSMKFDQKAFPNPDEMIKEFHDKYNCKLIVSV